MSEPMNLPAEIDLTKQQLDLARDIEEVREIRARAKVLMVYLEKHGRLLETHNRLAGIIALAERRIGQELRRAEREGSRQRRGGDRRSKTKIGNGDRSYRVSGWSGGENPAASTSAATFSLRRTR